MRLVAQGEVNALIRTRSVETLSVKRDNDRKELGRDYNFKVSFTVCNLNGRVFDSCNSFAEDKCPVNMTRSSLTLAQ